MPSLRQRPSGACCCTCYCFKDLLLLTYKRHHTAILAQLESATVKGSTDAPAAAPPSWDAPDMVAVSLDGSQTDGQSCPVCLDAPAGGADWRRFRCGHGLCYACLVEVCRQYTGKCSPLNPDVHTAAKRNDSDVPTVSATHCAHRHAPACCQSGSPGSCSCRGAAVATCERVMICVPVRGHGPCMWVM